jgi:hypothetical protein
MSTGAIDRLSGADASLYKMNFGSTLVTGTMTSGSWYKIVSISGTATFPAGYTPGDLFLGNGQTLNAGNQAQLATPVLLSDVTSFSLEFSRDEIEVTTLADDIKKYRPGKTDLNGTIEGINFISEMNKANSIVNRFMRTVSATAANSSTLRDIDESPLYGQFYIQDNTTASGETHAFLFGQIELYGYNLGASVADAQSWSSGLRMIGADPILYFKANS